MPSNKKGFTLIELLIVVVIIGILAAIAIPKFANTKEKAYLTAMKSDLRNMVTAQEAYFAEHARYTDALDATAFRYSTGVSEGGMTPTTGGFSAWVSYPTGTTKTCQIAVGPGSGNNEGEPICN
jgi:prepilin-type N-terminal cleavage/methylation domain-containing protein